MLPDSVQKAFYHLHFRAEFAEKKATAFQEFFVKIAGHAYGADFEEVRPYGKLGDLKCDGYRASSKTVFQCYAPLEMKDPELLKKIKADFSGAEAHWQSNMAEWRLVHNSAEGLSATATMLLIKIRTDHPTLSVEPWSKTELETMVLGLSLNSLIAIFGLAPSSVEISTLTLHDLKPVVDRLARQQPPAVTDMTPPSPDKVEQNGLSDDVVSLLIAGRRKEALLHSYLAKGPNVTKGEQIAQQFRMHYKELKEIGYSGDEIFSKLQAYAGGMKGHASGSMTKAVVFSDSRQDAANAALTIERAHYQDLRRQLIIEIARKTSSAPDNALQKVKLQEEFESAHKRADWNAVAILAGKMQLLERLPATGECRSR